MKKCEFYQKEENNKTKCLLCPHYCLIDPEHTGFCGVRKNVGGELFAVNYGKLSAVNLDPIEKKPLYHYYPGSTVLSIGSFGCNMRCLFCQNYEISQKQFYINEIERIRETTSEEIVIAAKENIKNKNIGVAYTYNEPTVFYEYMRNTAEAVKNSGMKNIVVTNGYINIEPLTKIEELIDAYNIDIKGFSNKFYRKYTGCDLESVKNVIKYLKHKNKHIELTNLVVTGANDSIEEFRQMVEWIRDEIGEETVLHISRYFPRYMMKADATKEATLIKFYETAKEKLKYVYIGNIATDFSNTICPSCGATVIKRQGYHIEKDGINNCGYCNKCGNKII